MPTENKTARTINTLIRVGRALRDPEPEAAPGAAGLGDAARRLGTRALGSARVQGLGAQVQELRAQAAARADQRLETLIAEARARRGETPPDEVALLLARRRQERDEQLERVRARTALLAQGETPEQRAVLTRVAAVTPWAGGETGALRYTQLLDDLAPKGGAVAEMAVHRALWTLAERRVLAVSPHGVVTAIPTLTAVPDALPSP
ncbi:hypothetical protein E7T09_18655 [Deinococcus sp. KSM4-11]|uniref:hypothetical protein n=1 Tax=Deinococcus sp. KSM4-11 TaxID=2568654 RepID=UPI0010A58EC3|nr:hypothetical protein [Deinococcus sp. KSM4-11]THF85060.1 hypothetical protein E7T09_18655 [Deinococcus sp. KSM4-11]